MIGQLERLVALQCGSCLDQAFRAGWETVVAAMMEYQRVIAEASGMAIACRKGCTECCCHWVEDVNSFEAEIIAAHVREHHPEAIGRIVELCRRDNEHLERLNAIVEKKTADCLRHKEIDTVDLLLASFYQLQRCCPLLENGLCLAYPVRPLTCRMYVSFGDPRQCHPDNINEYAPSTYLFDPEEEVNTLIDTLHFKYIRFHGDTGLRSQLVKYLSA
ncbi:MAG: hypothetical protein JW768_15630 [Chitinispirillaceae bacterium]|nr:hypothetical protein [Chitinispirillaceae bacterium]